MSQARRYNHQKDIILDFFYFTFYLSSAMKQLALCWVFELPVRVLAPVTACCTKASFFSGLGILSLKSEIKHSNLSSLHSALINTGMHVCASLGVSAPGLSLLKEGHSAQGDHYGFAIIIACQ
jgi:hypothetical protein